MHVVKRVFLYFILIFCMKWNTESALCSSYFGFKWSNIFVHMRMFVVWGLPWVWTIRRFLKLKDTHVLDNRYYTVSFNCVSLIQNHSTRQKKYSITNRKSFENVCVFERFVCLSVVCQTDIVSYVIWDG